MTPTANCGEQGSGSTKRSGSATRNEIVAAAREWPADLIVLGSHCRSPIARLLLGSVARAVLHRADCSVLIVRRRAETVQIVEGERVREATVVQRAPVVVCGTDHQGTSRCRPPAMERAAEVT